MGNSSPVPLSTPEQRRAASNYVLNHYSRMLTVEEKTAYKHVMGGWKIGNTSSLPMQQMLRKVFQTDDAGIIALMNDGEGAFFDRVIHRVIRERGAEIIWCLCPKCGALARMPRACLCPVCSHTWFEKREKV